MTPCENENDDENKKYESRQSLMAHGSWAIFYATFSANKISLPASFESTERPAAKTHQSDSIKNVSLSRIFSLG